MSDRNKMIFVIGPESSGSRLISQIIAHILGLREYGDWNGAGWAIDEHETFGDNVVHCSLPYGPDYFPDIDEWVEKYKNKDIYFVLTIRDQTIVDLSKKRRFRRNKQVCEMNRKRSREVLECVLNSDLKSFIWSYETFMYLKESYLKLLYNFLGIDSNFMVELSDGNFKYIKPFTYQIVLSIIARKRKLTKRLRGKSAVT